MDIIQLLYSNLHLAKNIYSPQIWNNDGHFHFFCYSSRCESKWHLSESLSDSFKDLFRKNWFIQKVTVFMSESMNHSLNWFVWKHWFVQELNKCLYEWVILSRNRFVQKHLFIREWNTATVFCSKIHNSWISHHMIWNYFHWQNKVTGGMASQI